RVPWRLADRGRRRTMNLSKPHITRHKRGYKCEALGATGYGSNQLGAYNAWVFAYQQLQYRRQHLKVVK
ncbi:MAG: hypothetical protein ACRETW_13600, partial [Stenotrophobium sp.]